jgi:hypothetical protein
VRGQLEGFHTLYIPFLVNGYRYHVGRLPIWDDCLIEMGEVGLSNSSPARIA